MFQCFVPYPSLKHSGIYSVVDKHEILCLCVSHPGKPIISTEGHDKNLLLYFITVTSQAHSCCFARGHLLADNSRKLITHWYKLLCNRCNGCQKRGLSLLSCMDCLRLPKSSCKDVLGFLRCFQAVANLMPQSAQIACSCVECQVCVYDVLLIPLSFSFLFLLFMHCLVWNQSDQVSVLKSFALFPAGPVSFPSVWFIRPNWFPFSDVLPQKQKHLSPLFFCLS